MRAKLFFSLIVAAGFALCSLPVLAQEDGQTSADIQELNSHQELNLNDDKTLLVEPEVKPSAKVAPVVRDSSMPQSSSKKQEQPQKSSSGTADKAKENALSFNFLYFIIQKFKISDIMDE